jgi:metal-responsive CopG/Arc/MetJ family transcriptional regulator
MTEPARKFTVSMPADLFAAVERDRRRAGRSRSEQLATVYRRHLQLEEERRRVSRYAAAYATTPETEVERWLTETSSELLVADES